jgi:hypothetical protein
LVSFVVNAVGYTELKNALAQSSTGLCGSPSAE